MVRAGALGSCDPACQTLSLAEGGVVTVARSLTAVASGALVAGLLAFSPWSPRTATAGPAPERATSDRPTSTARARQGAPSARAQEIAVRFVATGPGNTARYRVRERLMGKERDNDAVGQTSAIAGSIGLDANGALVRVGSLFTVEMAGLKSDQSRRDTYVRNRLLRTDSFPSTRLAVTGVRGLPWPLPAAGRLQFELLGDLTVKGVTRPTTWSVNAMVNGDRLTGTAATAFTFEQFQISQPKVSVVLSVSDTIRLEYDFAMQRQAR
jgi:polyisoprenoid-binding protein YceI